MKDFMAASLAHSVRVQNVRSRSRSSETRKFPSERRACQAHRIEEYRNGARYRHKRTRKRVMETTATA